VRGGGRLKAEGRELRIYQRTNPIFLVNETNEGHPFNFYFIFLDIYLFILSRNHYFKLIYISMEINFLSILRIY
jgi:hypothetical protein